MSTLSTLFLYGQTAVESATEIVTAESVQEAVTKQGQQVNLLWIVIGAALVVFMQAGFAMVETGFTRAKHAVHVTCTNFAIFGLGMVGFFLVGYSFMFGGYSYVIPGADFGYAEALGGPLLKIGDWVFLWHGGWALTGTAASSAAVLGFFLYMVAFMDTTATIPTGSMAERWNWKAFIGWGLFCGAIYYPLFGAWTWGGGWLSQLGNNLNLGAGYVDFAGSGIVHAMGGIAALTGAIVVGPRIGKFTKEGKPRGLPGHNIPMAFLGVFILLFGWFGFNAASTFAATDDGFARVALNTGVAAGFGSVAAMFWVMRRVGKPDPGMMANGMLAGLVAVTAPCYFIDPWAAAVIGLIAGVLVIEAIFFIERKMKIDDPVGAIAVHGVNGIFGVLAVGIFANGKYGKDWNLTEGVTGVKGLIKGDVGQFLAQGIGALVIIIVFGALSYGFFKLQDKFMKKGIRSSEEDEIAGLDLTEMGCLAYPDFVGTHESYGS